MTDAGDVRIKVKPEVLLKKGVSVSGSISRMYDCFLELERIICRTGCYWVGEAADAHRKLYLEQKANVDEMFRRLDEHPGELIRMAQRYLRADYEAAEISAGLPGNVIE